MVKASSGIIIDGKKVLLVKRSNYTKAFPGQWAFPGGRTEPDETPEHGVTREVKEETGLNFKPTKLFAKGKWEDRELYRFLGTWEGDVKIQQEELTDWNWFTYEDAVKLELAFDYREMIEKLHKEGFI